MPGLGHAPCCPYVYRSLGCLEGHCPIKELMCAGGMLAARASEVPPDIALAFVEALETRRAYLSNLTPLPALPGLLLVAEGVDTDATGQRFLVDGWLLLRVADGMGPAVRMKLSRIPFSRTLQPQQLQQ